MNEDEKKSDATPENIAQPDNEAELTVRHPPNQGFEFSGGVVQDFVFDPPLDVQSGKELGHLTLKPVPQRVPQGIAQTFFSSRSKPSCWSADGLMEESRDPRADCLPHQSGSGLASGDLNHSLSDSFPGDGRKQASLSVGPH